MVGAQEQIMEQIKCLTASYLQHNRNAYFTSEHLKYWDVYDIYNNAITPQQVVNYLHQPHGIIPFANLKRYEVLVMNRTPMWLWLIQAFLFVFTFPLTIPALMIFSWITRNTFNFMKTDGSIYLETVLDLCQQAGVTGPENLTYHPESTDTSELPTLTQGINMQHSTNSTSQDLFNTSVQPENRLSIQSDPNTHASSQLRSSNRENDDDIAEEIEKGMNGMAEMGRAFTQLMVDNPTMFVDVEVSRTKGKAVFLDAQPFERLSSKQWLQKFTYGAAWTKPWQELDVFGREIKVFREFTFVRRPKKTEKNPVNVVAATDNLSRLYAFGLSVFKSDTKNLLEQAWNNRGSAPTANKLYKNALDVAKNNEEYTNAMEGLINLHCGGIDWLRENASVFYRSEEAQVRYREEMSRMLRELDEYIDMLPVNYHQCSSTARTLQSYFDTVWNHLELHKRVQAWSVFDNKEIKALLDTPFVERCLPHYVALWQQIKGLFYLKNRYQEFYLEEEDEAETLQYYMNKTLDCLKENNIPEASSFEQEFAGPINQMQAHVEQIFQQVPRNLARQYAVQHFRDDRVWALEGRSACFRLEDRGQPTSIPSAYVEPYRDAVARINAATAQQSRLTM